MYSYEERKKAVDLYIKYSKKASAVINELGYPNRRVVEIEIGIYAGLQVLHCFIAFKVDVLVLEAPPKTLNPDEGLSPVFPVHADFNIVVFKHF